MRVLIISLPRTGSTTLLFRYAKEYELTPYFEPFYTKRKYDLPDNSVMKSIIMQAPEGVEDKVAFYTEYVNNYDKVTLLSRRDLRAQSESWAFMWENKSNGYKANAEYIYKPTGKEDYYYKWAQELQGDLERLSVNTGIDITYYEDIFDTNSKDKYRKEFKQWQI